MTGSTTDAPEYLIELHYYDNGLQVRPINAERRPDSWPPYEHVMLETGDLLSSSDIAVTSQWVEHNGEWWFWEGLFKGAPDQKFSHRGTHAGAGIWVRNGFVARQALLLDALDRFLGLWEEKKRSLATLRGEIGSPQVRGRLETYLVSRAQCAGMFPARGELWAVPKLVTLGDPTEMLGRLHYAAGLLLVNLVDTNNGSQSYRLVFSSNAKSTGDIDAKVVKQAELADEVLSQLLTAVKSSREHEDAARAEVEKLQQQLAIASQRVPDRGSTRAHRNLLPGDNGTQENHGVNKRLEDLSNSLKRVENRTNDAERLAKDVKASVDRVERHSKLLMYLTLPILVTALAVVFRMLFEILPKLGALLQRQPA